MMQKSKYQEDLNNVVQRDEKRGHFRKHFFLPNTDVQNYSKEIPSIRKYIYDISTQQDNLGVELPLKWIPLENELIKHREVGKNILSFQSIKGISDESYFLIEDEDEFKMFLKFHHDLGTDKISKLTDESMNLIRIQKISTELMCDILYELLLHDNYVGLKPRDESDITDLYSKIKGQNLRVPSKGLGGQRLPNESIQTNWRRCRENTVDQK
ncbi:unnamed protein product [Mytilus edulis]|uniref:Uncharacterized protein n=1 Tax=Mytilus edulis TaxID=6550 RepID=A0A8S3RV66_MYTED|nr:unnamed protein product [Mytilus edulis]